MALTATTQYLFDHHYHYPFAAAWEEEIRPYWKANIPFTVTLTGGRRLAMNRDLSGARHGMPNTTDDTVLFYETTATKKDVSGTPPNFPLRQATGTVPVVICVDGHMINE